MRHMGEAEQLSVFEAAKYGKLAELKQLVQANPALVNESNVWGEFPLHYAAAYGDFETVRWLLFAGADVKARTLKGVTVLHLADRPEIVRLLVMSGANVHAIDAQGRTPLHEAARSSPVEAVRILLAAGAAVNARDNEGAAPLHEAASLPPGKSAHGRLEVARLLLDADAYVNEPDKSGRTPLHRAASLGHTQLVHLLLQRGADPAARDDQGKAPLDGTDGSFMAREPGVPDASVSRFSNQPGPSRVPME
jgi:ankyrin repeat protein